MSVWVDSPTLVGLPKIVVPLSTFETHRILEESKERLINSLREAIESDSPIDRKFYRNYYNEQDDVYDDMGMLHLHLGGDDLLMVVQYDDKVVFVCTASHTIFNERPKKAQSIKARHSNALQQQDITPAPAFTPREKVPTVNVEIKKKKNMALLRANYLARQAKKPKKDSDEDK